MYKHMDRNLVKVLGCSAIITFILFIGFGVEGILMAIVTFGIVVCMLLLS